LKTLLIVLLPLGWAVACAADETTAAVPPAVNRALPDSITSKLAARPRQITPAAPASSAASDADAVAGPNAGSSASPARFSAEDKWLTAGYNNDEIVYTVVVTSQDSRILHCSADVQGFYLEQGKKLTITDRQTLIVFPNQPTQIGNWMDLDQASGASYSVKCRPT
jgi:hypothetical protein